ncbi:MAG: ankyrin repeat domain-containing protein [Alphaproteobacteria bacterium]
MTISTYESFEYTLKLLKAKYSYQYNKIYRILLQDNPEEFEEFYETDQSEEYKAYLDNYRKIYLYKAKTLSILAKASKQNWENLIEEFIQNELELDIFFQTKITYEANEFYPNNEFKQKLHKESRIKEWRKKKSQEWDYAIKYRKASAQDKIKIEEEYSKRILSFTNNKNSTFLENEFNLHKLLDLTKYPFIQGENEAKLFTPAQLNTYNKSYYFTKEIKVKYLFGINDSDTQKRNIKKSNTLITNLKNWILGINTGPESQKIKPPSERLTTLAKLHHTKINHLLDDNSYILLKAGIISLEEMINHFNDRLHNENDLTTQQLILEILNNKLESLNPEQKAQAVIILYSMNQTQLASTLVDDIDINAQDVFGRTALMMCVKSENIEAIKLLLSKNANVNLADNYGDTALMHAAESGNIDTLELLIDKGAELKTVNKCAHSVLHSAVKSQNIECVKFLFEKGYSFDVAENNFSEVIDEVLASAVFIASSYKNSEIIEFLISKLNDVETKNTLLGNALSHAVLTKDKDLLMLLLNNGADINAVNKYKVTALMRAIEGKRFEIAKLLIDNGANLNIHDDIYHDTALMLSCKKGDKKAVELLLKHGADIRIQSRYGETALSYAFKGNHTEIVMMILKHTKDKNINLGLENLFSAYRKGDKSVKQLVIEQLSLSLKEACIKAFNKFYITPIVIFSDKLVPFLSCKSWQGFVKLVKPLDSIFIQPLRADLNEALNSALLPSRTIHVMQDIIKSFTKFATPVIVLTAVIKGLFTFGRDLNRGDSFKSSLKDGIFEFGKTLLQGSLVAFAGALGVMMGDNPLILGLTLLYPLGISQALSATGALLAISNGIFGKVLAERAIPCATAAVTMHGVTCMINKTKEIVGPYTEKLFSATAKKVGLARE